jgi:uncharacterized Zn-binding protein involved in type VI secretion
MPSLAREGDSVSTGHGCSGSTTLTSPLGGVYQVYANGLGIECLGDPTVSHTYPVGDGCVPHVAYINSGSSSVFINNTPVGRVGDSADAGQISSGSNNVFAGG